MFILNPILQGLLEVRYCIGGIKMNPPYQTALKLLKLDKKGMFWQIFIIFVHDLYICRLTGTIFELWQFCSPLR